MEFEKLLRLMVEKGGSDLFITAGVPPSMKVNGKVLPVTKNALTPEQTRELVYGAMNSKQQAEFEDSHECNFAISARGIGRFRVSAFFQRNLCGMVLRRIETKIPQVDDLGLPDIIKDLAMTKRGLIIFVGAQVPVSPPPWRPCWVTVTATAAATLSPSRIPLNSCTSTRVASLPSGKWVSTPRVLKRP